MKSDATHFLNEVLDWLSRQRDFRDNRKATRKIPASIYQSLRKALKTCSYAEILKQAQTVVHKSETATAALKEGSLAAILTTATAIDEVPLNMRNEYLDLIGYYDDLNLGWYPSLKHKLANTDPKKITPWITYSATEFILDYDLSAYQCIEFGGGMSTLFFAQRCKGVTTYESDQSFVNILSNWLDDHDIYNVNFEKEYQTSNESLIQLSSKMPTIILIDGDTSSRATSLNSAMYSLRWAKHPIILIVDDSDIPSYKKSFGELKAEGFVPINLYGPKPGQPFRCSTSIFLSKHQHFMASASPNDHSRLFGIGPFQNDTVCAENH
jgi:hypothetical protein